MAENGLAQTAGYDAVIVGNIPGGGMSRSASLCINLILTGLEVSGLELAEEFDIINFSQAVENDYTGSPCGQLDQIMIYYAKAGMGTHYNPADQSIKYVPIGADAPDWRIVALDTGNPKPPPNPQRHTCASAARGGCVRARHHPPRPGELDVQHACDRVR